MNFFIILVITIILEFLVYLIIIRKKVLNLLIYSILINSVTNPIVNLFFNISGPKIIIVEFFVFFVEIFLIKYLFDIKYWKSFLISFIANILSFVSGIFIFSLI